MTQQNQSTEPVAWANTINLDSTWDELLGVKRTDMLDSERRKRWATWIRIARHTVGRDLARNWAGRQERCSDCRHSRGGWCIANGLPCSVNPYLTRRTGVPGMACMGAGFEPRQLALDF